mmetsp:Transcript_8719/g.11985  ORF Transcript_8719/g.11985 Transcript_8719/m.11985 type:complete len:91 (+) Transcript_8719:81-353(+)
MNCINLQIASTMNNYDFNLNRDGETQVYNPILLKLRVSKACITTLHAFTPSPLFDEFSFELGSNLDSSSEIRSAFPSLPSNLARRISSKT